MKTLYPEILPYQTFFLETGSKHAVYVEQSGNPDGLPVIFLHGGPCSGTKPDHRRFFNPEKYRIILFDQRGCGQSLPFGELEDNATQDLIDDMERIRKRLNIDQWLLFGGSWGGALALLYAQQHTDKVMGMIIRGVFLARKQDLDWFAKSGAGLIYPEQWQRLIESIPARWHKDPVQGLCDALWGDDEMAKRRVAKEWMAWGGQVALGKDYQLGPEADHVTEKIVKQVSMEMHYARNRYFIRENQILEGCDRLRSIPTVIIHGRNDLVCPMEAGMRLHQALPEAEYIVLPNAGHVAQGEEMIDALVSATDKFAEKQVFKLNRYE
ncbi:prolyl aminopeptidase [Methylobacter sp. YRD-M1]|uniref:prolyl aminopeptidase n=1 Tax=Methylobacter sp. YRD-M1 TaxID=2911520 RepID=UPI00227A3813|nr:prolyl aminopeptidase [Methylobacter sp. YRD-M1]WAK01798.1 prolyl aminopeptidase [Methylobacter sp. YRD-M1]